MVTWLKIVLGVALLGALILGVWYAVVEVSGYEEGTIVIASASPDYRNNTRHIGSRRERRLLHLHLTDERLGYATVRMIVMMLVALKQIPAYVLQRGDFRPSEVEYTVHQPYIVRSGGWRTSSTHNIKIKQRSQYGSLTYEFEVYISWVTVIRGKFRPVIHTILVRDYKET